jgi:hypothetical protein
MRELILIRLCAKILAMVLGVGGLSAAFSEEKEAVSDHGFTLTIAPVMLAWSTVDVSAEVRVLRAWSLAARVARTDERWGVNGQNLWDLGVQARYYPRQLFSGLHGGVGLSWWYDDELGGNISGTWGGGEAWALSPFAGYKCVHRTGLTAELQAGVNVALWTHDPSPDDKGRFAFLSPLLRFNLGWSF